MIISIGASVRGGGVSQPDACLEGSKDSPTRENTCQAKSLTRSTSVVINVMICALLEKSSSSSFLPSTDDDEPEASISACWEAVGAGGGELEATSFRTSVLAYRIELSWILRRTWIAVVANDHNCPVTRICKQTEVRTSMDTRKLTQE